MRVEAELIKRSQIQAHARVKSTLGSELQGWRNLFSDKYVDRVGIGIAMMFFQRKIVL